MSNNPNWPPNQRLTPDIVAAILMSKGPAEHTQAQLRRYGITISTSMIRKIWYGRRWTSVSRVGTMWDPDPATAAAGAPMHQPGYRRKRAKRWARRPPYLTRTGRLRKGYRLVPLEAA